MTTLIPRPSQLSAQRPSQLSVRDGAPIAREYVPVGPGTAARTPSPETVRPARRETLERLRAIAGRTALEGWRSAAAAVAEFQTWPARVQMSVAAVGVSVTAAAVVVIIVS